METWAKVLIVVMAALNGLGLLLNAGLKKYVEEKVTHLATKEDLNDLVEEVRQKAVATKEGEIAAISAKLDEVVRQNNRLTLESEEIKRQVSGKQRIWELKKEAIYDVVKSIGRLLHLVTLYGAAAAGHRSNKQLMSYVSKMSEAAEEIRQEVGKTWPQDGIISLLFDEDVSAVVRSVSTEVIKLLAALPTLSTEETDARSRNFAVKCAGVMDVLKIELAKD